MSHMGKSSSRKSLSGILLSLLGIHPVNWLPPRYSRRSWRNLPSSSGICPVKLLLRRSSVTKSRILLSWGGISPVNWFPPSLSVFSCGPKSLNSTGISPVRSLLAKLSESSSLIFPNAEGISPVNWLPLRSTLNRPSIWPSSEGMPPVNWLPWSPRNCSLSRPVNLGDISPVRPLFIRSNACTYGSR